MIGSQNVHCSYGDQCNSKSTDGLTMCIVDWVKLSSDKIPAKLSLIWFWP